MFPLNNINFLSRGNAAQNHVNIEACSAVQFLRGTQIRKFLKSLY